MTLEQMRVRMLEKLLTKPNKYKNEIAETEKLIEKLTEEIPKLREDLTFDVGTDEELSEDEERKQNKAKRELEGLLGGPADDMDLDESSSSSSEEETPEEKAKRLEKKRIRNLKRKLRAKKRSLKNATARLELLKNKVVWNKISTENFSSLKPEKEFSQIKKKKAPKVPKKKSEIPINLKTLKAQKVGYLKEQLLLRGLDAEGTKPVLLKRLEEKVKEEETKAKKEQTKDWKDELETDLVQLHGTKLASAVQFLKRLLYKPEDETKKAKILIFSQFSTFLHKVGDFLRENGIENVFIEGNVIRREQAISSFKGGEIQVMMLSLDHAASGTNLTEATHVVLLDPIQGTLEEARAIEDQAVGRAFRQGQKESVTVVRFLISGTIEHDQYLKRKKTKAVIPHKKLVRTHSESTLLANCISASHPVIETDTTMNK